MMSNDIVSLSPVHVKVILHFLSSRSADQFAFDRWSSCHDINLDTAESDVYKVGQARLHYQAHCLRLNVIPLCRHAGLF